MGRIGKGIKCSVVDCNNNSIRSLSRERVSSSGLKVREGRRVYLCVVHYKQWKKGTKKVRELDRVRYGQG